MKKNNNKHLLIILNELADAIDCLYYSYKDHLSRSCHDASRIVYKDFENKLKSIKNAIYVLTIWTNNNKNKKTIDIIDKKMIDKASSFFKESENIHSTWRIQQDNKIEALLQKYINGTLYENYGRSFSSEYDEEDIKDYEKWFESLSIAEKTKIWQKRYDFLINYIIIKHPSFSFHHDTNRENIYKTEYELRTKTGIIKRELKLGHDELLELSSDLLFIPSKKLAKIVGNDPITEKNALDLIYKHFEQKLEIKKKKLNVKEFADYTLEKMICEFFDKKFIDMGDFESSIDDLCFKNLQY